jgi:hypothetical protein
MVGARYVVIMSLVLAVGECGSNGSSKRDTQSNTTAFDGGYG